MNPELGQDISLFHLILHASAPVQAVIVILLGASMMSWWYIFIKMFALKRALRETDSFEREFWGGGDMQALFRRVSARREDAGEMGRIFNSVGPQLKEHYAIRKSLELAMEVQQNLLPAADPVVEGLDIAGRSHYCENDC